MKITSSRFTHASIIILGLVTVAGCGSETGGAGGNGGNGGTGGTGTEAPAALTGKDLAGHWVSKGCEAYPDGKGGNSYLTRDFTLTTETWDLSLTIFGDDKCASPLFTSQIHGPYTLGALSAKVEGATEGQFGVMTNLWTAHAQAMADTFAMTGCGTGTWELEKAQDVTTTGCIGVAHKIAECPAEFDIVAIEGEARDALYFGQRITDMCTEAGRPTAVAAYAVYKK